MTFQQLEAEHTVCESIPLDQCTEDQLRIKLAYALWSDGADWPVVLEMRNDNQFSKEQLINYLNAMHPPATL